MNILETFKKEAGRLFTEFGIKYSDKSPDVAAWMFDHYIEATENGDEIMRDRCAAGLMCRYWSVFTTKNVGVPVDYDTKISYGWEGINYALKYRVWQKPERGVNADQAAKQAIHTIFLQHNYLANLDKSRANNCCGSIDEEISDFCGGEGKTTIGDTLADEEDLISRRQTEDARAVRSMIQLYIDRKKLVEAIVLDTIAFNEVEKVTKKTVKDKDTEGNPRKYTKTYREFWPFKCVQILSQLPEGYAKYFGENYNFNPVEFDKALEAVRAANNQKLYRILRSTLADAKEVFSY